MQYRSLDQIGAEADVLAAPNLPVTTSLSRRERLKRWAEILEHEPRRRLHALHDIEYKSQQELLAYRVDNSPLSVAYADPVLRAAGLRSETVGDARRVLRAVARPASLSSLLLPSRGRR